MRYDVHEFLGEVVVDLHSHPVDDEAEWYMLTQHQDQYPGAVRTFISHLTHEKISPTFF